MGRLIDVDKFKAVNGMKDDCADCDKELRGKSKACEFDRVYTKMDFCGWLDDAPTVDAVPVVRCKDCKHWKTAEGVKLSKRLKCCTYHIGHKYVRCDEDFCSRGERKDGNDNG